MSNECQTKHNETICKQIEIVAFVAINALAASTSHLHGIKLLVETFAEVGEEQNDGIQVIQLHGTPSRIQIRINIKDFFLTDNSIN